MAGHVEVTEEQYARAYHRAFGIDTTLVPSEAKALLRELNEVLNERWYAIGTATITDGDFTISVTSNRVDSDRPARSAIAEEIAAFLNRNGVRRQ